MQLEEEGFKRFDWGVEGNMREYGTQSPPDYHIENIKYPVAVMYGSKDALADPLDVQWTMSKLQDTLVFSKE